MKSIIVWKAQPPVKKEPVESVEIIISAEVPEMNSLQLQDEVFEKDAILLCDALQNALPGGTFDRLLVEMMKRKVTHFVVPINS